MVVIYKETRDYTSNDVIMWYVVKFIKLRQQLPHSVPYVVETRTVSVYCVFFGGLVALFFIFRSVDTYPTVPTCKQIMSEWTGHLQDENWSVDNFVAETR